MIRVLCTSCRKSLKNSSWIAATVIDGQMVCRLYGRTKSQRIEVIQDDNLFLLLDADEIPDASELLFFKLYDGSLMSRTSGALTLRGSGTVWGSIIYTVVKSLCVELEQKSV